jgi:hypothetical protein
MRRSLAMCAMVVAGMLSWPMLPMGVTRLAEAQSTTCEENLVGKAFTCTNVGQEPGEADELCLVFVSSVPPPEELIGDFQLNITLLAGGPDGGPPPCPGGFSNPIGCSCRPTGSINDPDPNFDQDSNAFLCTGVIPFGPIGPIAFVGRLTGSALNGDGVFLGLSPEGGACQGCGAENFFFACQQVQ